MSDKSIILFDGVCNLCNSAVLFVIKRDNHQHFMFASLQSPEGKKLLADKKVISELNSFFLIENGEVYNRSTAALKVAQKLTKPWAFLYSFIVVPRFIRDAVYNFIAKHRYRWFGRQNECMIPSPELQARFLS